MVLGLRFRVGAREKLVGAHGDGNAVEWIPLVARGPDNAGRNRLEDVILLWTEEKKLARRNFSRRINNGRWNEPGAGKRKGTEQGLFEKRTARAPGGMDLTEDRG